MVSKTTTRNRSTIIGDDNDSQGGTPRKTLRGKPIADRLRPTFDLRHKAYTFARKNVLLIGLGLAALYGYSKMGTTEKDAKSKARITKVTELGKFKLDLTAAEIADKQSDLEKLARNEISQQDATEKLMDIFKKDTLTDAQILAKRENDPNFVMSARDRALDDLQDELNDKVFGERKITSHYNPKRIHPLYGKIKKHKGVDLRGYAGQPISCKEDLTFIRSKTSSDLSYFVVQQGDDIRYRGLHSKALTSQFKKGDVIPAGTAFAVTSKKDRHSDAAHLHLEVSIKRNGEWSDWGKDNPEPYAKNFPTLNQSELRADLSPFLAAQILKADNMTAFDNISGVINQRVASKQFKKSYTKELASDYARLKTNLRKNADSILASSIQEDYGTLVAAFAPGGTELMVANATKSEPSAKDFAVNKKSPGAPMQSSIATSFIGGSNIFTKKAKEKADITVDVSSVKWGKHMNRISEKELRKRILDNPNTDDYAAKAGMNKKELAEDLIRLTRDHENGNFDPNSRSTTSSAVGLWQFTSGTQQGIGSSYNLPKWPSDKYLATDKGIKIQVDYALANWDFNLGIAKQRDRKFQEENNGRKLYNTTYIRPDGTADSITYRQGAIGAWCGAGTYNANLENAQKRAIKDGVPYAKYKMAAPNNQDFTSYAAIGKTDAHNVSEGNAHKTIAADPTLANYYSSKKTITKPSRTYVRKEDSAVTTTTESKIIMNFVPTVQADTVVAEKKSAPRVYQYKID